jgi:CBS-domain-containing membrane protein
VPVDRYKMRTRGLIYSQLRHFNKRVSRIVREFRSLWKNYIYQSFLATLVVLMVFWLLSTTEAVIVASIGSTAFIVFTMPTSFTATSRRVIGGHATGLLCGILGVLILQQWSVPPIIIYSFTVGLSIFLMVALDFEHPPASGTALGVVISGFSLKVIIATLASAVVLSLAHHYLKKYLKDLV